MRISSHYGEGKARELHRNCCARLLEFFCQESCLFQAAKRQYELKDPSMRDNLAAARAVLKKHSMMLLTASKAYVRHPELAAAKENRDFVFRQVLTILYN